MFGGVDHGALPPTDSLAAPAPPENPTVLNGTEAVAMAVARLLLAGINRNSRPAKLLGVDDTQSCARIRS